MSAYVLVLVGLLMRPPVVTHEFTSLASCTAAAAWYTNFNSVYSTLRSNNGLYQVSADCIAKGVQSPASPKYTFTVFGAPGGPGVPTPQNEGAAVLHDFNNFDQCAAAVAFVQSLAAQPGNLWVDCFAK